MLALGFVGEVHLYLLSEKPVKSFSLLHRLRAPFRHEPISGIYFVDLPHNKKSLIFFAYERQHAQLSLDDFKLSFSSADGSENKTFAMCKGKSTLFALEDNNRNLIRYEI